MTVYKVLWKSLKYCNPLQINLACAVPLTPNLAHAAIRQWSSNDEPCGQNTSTGQCPASAYATFKDWTHSMKRNDSIGSRVELSSFSPMSHLTSCAESAFNSDINDLTDILNEEWVTSELGLDPEVFLIS